MLTLTNNAVDAIQRLTSQPDLPDQTGLRIASEAEGSPSLSLAVTTGPQPGDQVVEDQGARVFLDGMAAQMLDDKALDAEVNPDGAVRFTLAEQPG